MIAIAYLWKFIAGAVAGLIIGFAAALLYDDAFRLPAARSAAHEAGVLAERAVWTELDRKARAKAADDLAKHNPKSTPSSANITRRTQPEPVRWLRLRRHYRSKSMRPTNRQPWRLPLCAALLLSLAGCHSSSDLSAPLRLATVPQSLLLPCPDASVIPPRDLETTEAVRLWSHDRQALGECRARHAALSQAAVALAGQGQPSNSAAR